ncbi:hypothetical protein, partial [Schnuerera sp.]|uniref:hypothetical protein n=1 Tax=Schnuerera sp. TaxID=2794844 RepID=UPI002CA34E54
MFNKNSRLVPFILAIVLLLSQGVVFAEDTNSFAVEISGEGVENKVKLTLDDLKSMPEEAQIHEEYIYNSKSGEKSVMVKGVSLSYVLKEEAGVTIENAEVNFEASDGDTVSCTPSRAGGSQDWPELGSRYRRATSGMSAEVMSPSWLRSSRYRARTFSAGMT